MKLRSQGKAIPSTPPYHPAWLSCVPATPVKKRIAVVRIERRDVVLFSTVFSHGPGEARILFHGGDKIHNPIPIANQGQYPVWAAGSGDKLCRQNCAEDDPAHHGGQEAAADTWKQNVDTPPSGSVYPKSQAAGSSWRTTPDTGCCWCFTGTWPDCRAGNTCRSCDGTRGS